MRILIAEDDAILADGLLRAMKEEGYAADLATSGEDADTILMQRAHDLVILDLGLPVIDGFQVLQRLRKRKSDIPVLILTARGTLDDRVKGLDLGADDYLAKPFDIPELEARVRALTRRVYNRNRNELRLGTLSFDLKGRRVAVNGTALEIPGRELGVLEMLMKKAGSVVSKEQIMESLCSYDEDVSDNAIEVYIHRLRKRTAEAGIVIRTIRGLGYMMDHSTDE